MEKSGGEGRVRREERMKGQERRGKEKRGEEFRLEAMGCTTNEEFSAAFCSASKTCFRFPHYQILRSHHAV